MGKGLNRKRGHTAPEAPSNPLTLAQQMRIAASGIHPIVSIIAGQMHGLNSFIALFEAGGPAPELRKQVNEFVGHTLIAIGQDYVSRVQEATNEEYDGGHIAEENVANSQQTSQLVSSDGSPLGGGK